MLYINKLTDKQFYNVLGGYAKGVRLRKLLKRYHYTPNMFIKDTLRGNKIKAMDFCLAASKHFQRRAELYRKDFKTKRCIPLNLINPRRTRRAGISAYHKQAPLSKMELEKIDDFFFG
jgi:hypothetical protein|nr:MAG: hypothetical protein [Bacteriophage sp.]UVX79352.1 MAG: hypothetical protein [Bacteriophage sp.]UWG03823.1 MAG: hypothetical protein [Bacteriophage sp.]UWI31845.1 MAG: hypothetical protein [Bacteriophage sp.]DAW46357.1 MAG TPA: hypothetical protein [Caudoviricetes sp.]